MWQKKEELRRKRDGLGERVANADLDLEASAQESNISPTNQYVYKSKLHSVVS